MNRRLLVMPLVAAAAAFAIWKWSPQASAGPACTWRTGTGTEIQQGVNFDKLAPDTPVRLSVHSPEPLFFYVWSQSAEDGTLLLFPSPEVQSDCTSPLPNGQTVLPGKLDGKELAWTTRSGVRAATTFLAIASKERIPALDDLMAKVRIWSNRVLTDRSMQVRNPAPGTEVMGKPHTNWPDPLLEAAAKQLQEQELPNGPMQPLANHPGIWVSSWKAIEIEKH